MSFKRWGKYQDVLADKLLQKGNVKKIHSGSLGILWHIQTCSGILRDNQAYLGIFRHSGIFRTLHNPGIFRTQVYSVLKTYSEPCQISRMERFARIVNGLNDLDKLFLLYQLFTFSNLWKKYRDFFNTGLIFTTEVFHCM